MLETGGVAGILEVSDVTAKDEVVNKEVDGIGEKEDRMEDEGITTGVAAMTELSGVATRDGVDGIGVGTGDKIEDETETVEVATTELSDIPTRDGVGEMNEEVDDIGVKEDWMLDVTVFAVVDTITEISDARDEVISDGVNDIGVEKEDWILETDRVGVILEVSAVTAKEVVNKESDSIVEKEDRMEDVGMTPGVSARTELSDINTRDGVGEMNEEVEGIGVKED